MNELDIALTPADRLAWSIFYAVPALNYGECSLILGRRDVRQLLYHWKNGPPYIPAVCLVACMRLLVWIAVRIDGPNGGSDE